jgi:putative peptidoglycan lipid II flippase
MVECGGIIIRPVTFLLALSSLLSRLIGIYRNHALASVFGASAVSDAYFAAFQVPDTLYRLLVYGAISASFVPLFLRLRKKNPDEAWDFVASVMNSFLLVVLILAILIAMFADPLVSLLYPRFTPEMQDTTVTLLRIMMISPILFTMSSVFSGIENAFRNFWGFAVAPILYNLAIIFGVLVLTPYVGIMGAAYGVVIGAFLHAFIQFIPCVRLGFRWRPIMIWSAAFKQLVLTAIPRVLSMAANQINFFIEGIIATMLLVGNLTVLRYAQDLQSFPIGIIGVSMAISSFSIVSHFVIDEKIPQLASYLRDKLEHILLLMIPAAFGLYILRFPLINLILGGGDFDQVAVMATAQTLSYLCWGVVAAAITPLVSRVFFAFHDTFWPFVVAVATVLINTLLALVFSSMFGVAGIGFSSSVSSFFLALALMVILQIKYFRASSYFPWQRCLAFLFASAVMAMALNAIMKLFVFSEVRLLLTAQVLFMTILGVLLYLGVSYLIFGKRLIHLIRGIGN